MAYYSWGSMRHEERNQGAYIDDERLARLKAQIDDLSEMINSLERASSSGQSWNYVSYGRSNFNFDTQHQGANYQYTWSQPRPSFEDLVNDFVAKNNASIQRMHNQGAYLPNGVWVMQESTSSRGIERHLMGKNDNAHTAPVESTNMAPSSTNKAEPIKQKLREFKPRIPYPRRLWENSVEQSVKVLELSNQVEIPNLVLEFNGKNNMMEEGLHMELNEEGQEVQEIKMLEPTLELIEDPLNDESFITHTLEEKGSPQEEERGHEENLNNVMRENCNSILYSYNSNFSFSHDFVGTSHFMEQNEANDDIPRMQVLSRENFKSLENFCQLCPSPQLMGGNLDIVDNTLQSKYFLNTSLRAIILGLGSFECDDIFEGIIDALVDEAIFIYVFTSFIENMICVSKELHENEVYAFDYIEPNTSYASHFLQKPPLFLNKSSCLLYALIGHFFYKGMMRKHDEWKEFSSSF